MSSGVVGVELGRSGGVFVFFRFFRISVIIGRVYLTFFGGGSVEAGGFFVGWVVDFGEGRLMFWRNSCLFFFWE